MRTATLLLLLALFGCAAETRPPLVASDIEITRPVAGMDMSAGYLTLQNNTDAAIVVTRVQSPQYARVEIHETTIEDGISKMRALDSLTVPANGAARLERGGKHLMLMQARDQKDSVTLQLMSGETLLLSVQYRFDPT
ncbi:MAG TPA: copper chaperone PCu(A)C [Woeseiaceae bacterium]